MFKMFKLCILPFFRSISSRRYTRLPRYEGHPYYSSTQPVVFVSLPPTLKLLAMKAATLLHVSTGWWANTGIFNSVSPNTSLHVQLNTVYILP